MIQADANSVLILLLIAAVIIIPAVIVLVQAAKRREAWQKLAAQLGCSFSPKDDQGIPDSFPHSLFHHGHGRRASNVIYGQLVGRQLKCFDYLYREKSGSGKNRREHTYYYTCLLLTAPIPFQALSIRPESFLDRVGEFFGIDDIDFESDEFSRRFFVKCPDKRFAYDILHARTMELLLAGGKIYVEAQSEWVLFYYSGSLRVPEQVEPLIQTGRKFLDLTPNYLIEQLGGKRG